MAAFGVAMPSLPMISNEVCVLGTLDQASVAALQKFPTFNASLDAGGENLVHRGLRVAAVHAGGVDADRTESLARA